MSDRRVYVLPRDHHSAQTVGDHDNLVQMLCSKPGVVMDAMRKTGCHRLSTLQVARRIRSERPEVWARILAEARANGIEDDL